MCIRDRKYSNSPDYIAPVTTEDVIAAINELMHRTGYTQEENGEVTSGMDEERLIGIKIGKYLAMMDK